MSGRKITIWLCYFGTGVGITKPHIQQEVRKLCCGIKPSTTILQVYKEKRMTRTLGHIASIKPWPNGGASQRKFGNANCVSRLPVDGQTDSQVDKSSTAQFAGKGRFSVALRAHSY